MAARAILGTMNEQPVLSPASLDAVSSPDAIGVGGMLARGLSRISAVPTVRDVWVERLATPAAIVGLCVLGIAFFWRVVGLHQVLLPLDVLTVHDPVWHVLSPNAGTLPRNGLDSDNLTEFYPWTAIAAEALRNHSLPLWNPYAFSGTPFLGAMQTAVLYPVNLVLEFLLAPIDVLGFRALIHLIITLTGTFVLARRFGLTRLAAMLTAISFGFSLPYVVWLEHPMSGALAWTPWLLFCVEGTIAAMLARRHVGLWIAAGASAWALEFLAGHGESTLHVGLLVGAFALFRSSQRQRRSGRGGAALVAPLTGAGVALLLGMGVAAAQLLPSLATIPASEAALDRATAATIEAPTAMLGDPSAWSSLANAVIPDINGAPTWQVPLAGAGGYNELALYVGAIPLILGGLALLRRRGSARDADTGMILFLGAAGIAALGVAVHLPVFNAINALPLFRVAANGRLRLEYAFCLAMLAGYGLDMLRHRDQRSDQVDRMIVRSIWTSTVFWTVMAAVIAEIGLVALVHGPQDGPKATRVPGVSLDIALHAAVPVAWFLLFGIVVWAWRKRLLPTSIVRWGAVVLTSIDLFALGFGYHTTTTVARATTIPPAVSAVVAQGKRDGVPFRVAGLGNSLLPSISSLYGLQDIRGYDPAYSADYERFYSAAFSLQGMRLKVAPFGPSPIEARAFDLLNVRYIFAGCGIPLNHHYYRPIFSDGAEGCVYRNETALARAYEVHSVSWAAPRAAAQLLGSGAVDPREQVLLDPSTVGDRAAWHVSSAPVDADRVTVTAYGLNDVTLRVRSKGKGVVVLGDAYASGWVATVDGHPALMARADGILRAVPVTGGTHVVAFHYQPTSFSIGILISAGALMLWFVLCLALVWARLTRQAVGRRRKPRVG